MTAVKICGVTGTDDALAAAEAGADAVGFVFYPKSPRCVTPEIAAEIAARLPPHVAKIGVFVNETAPGIAVIAQAAALDAVQLCGDEPAALAAAIRRPVIRAWRAVPPGGIPPAYPCRALLADAGVPGRYGGTGRAADEATIEAVRAAGKPWILAGGLGPVSAALAVARFGPDAVDVSSWVESRPGVKDRARMIAFVDAVKRRGARNDGFAALLRPASRRAA